MVTKEELDEWMAKQKAEGYDEDESLACLSMMGLIRVRVVREYTIAETGEVWR